jgi:hypothetical protein
MSDVLETPGLGGLVVDWPVCGAGGGGSCTGIRVGFYGRCWAHLTSEELAQALGSLSPGGDVDARGTELGGELLDKILGTLRDPNTNRLQIADARFEGARFGSRAGFFGVKFAGYAGFADAKFGPNAGFGNAQFSGPAEFTGAKFSGPVAFGGARFSGPVAFYKAEFSGAAAFGGAKFAVDARFDRARFAGDARFGGARFHGDAVFDHGKFGGDTGFDSVKFGGAARFVSASFGGQARFDGAEFTSNAWYLRAEFGHTARFGQAKFSHDVWFNEAKFSQDVWFNEAKFSRDARFDEVHAEGGLVVGPSVVGGTLALRRVQVGGVVRVAAAAKRLDCEGGEFGGRVWFSLWDGEAWLTDSVFTGPVTVESSLEPIGPAALEQVAQLPETCSRVVLRSLRGADAENLTLVDVDLGRCVLSGLRRPELLRLDGRCAFRPVPPGWCVRWRWVPWRWMTREAVFEEHVWRQSECMPGWTAEPGEGADDSAGAVVGPARLAVLYRQLRRAVEGAGNAPGAADLYYGEMEMRRLGAVRRGERWLLNGYWLVSGYGLRAWRALAVLGVLVVAAGLLLQRGGYAGPSPNIAGCLLYAAGSVLSIDAVIQGVPAVLTQWGEAIRLVLRVAGPLLLGLAALAVRGRVKR